MRHHNKYFTITITYLAPGFPGLPQQVTQGASYVGVYKSENVGMDLPCVFILYTGQFRQSSSCTMETLVEIAHPLGLVGKCSDFCCRYLKSLHQQM